MLKRNFIAIAFMMIVGSSLQAQLPVLHFSADKKFKIVQFTDTHIKAEDPKSEAAFKTIAEVLDKEKPNLVVFTGDVVTGKPVDKGWEMVTKPVIERKLPFAVVFGNHDDENGMSRAQISELLVKMPGCLFVPKVENVFGFGNYVLEVKASTGNGNSALLYCMDSNAYSTLEDVEGYGWFHFDQINWYREQSRKQAAANDKVLPALAFFHIPLPEYNEAYKNEKNPPIGLRLEDECSPKINSGMFTAMLECGDVMGTFVGHDHVNDYIAYLHGIALAYGRFSGGKTTYSETPNGGRIIELTEGERAFKTWIRTGEGDVLLLVEFPVDFQPKK
jgi:predicted MPP superfamily phosphohydrolase